MIQRVEHGTRRADAPARCVVFGGSGFVGSHLVAALHRAGARSITIVDLERPATLRRGVTWVRCDVRCPQRWIPRGPVDAVYNLAAVHRTPGPADEEFHATNTGGARNVTDFCRLHDVRRLVFTSSIAVYGAGEDPKDERTPPNPTSAYGVSKVSAERIHRAWAAEDSARRLVTVRPGVLFGRGEGGNFTRLARALRRHLFVYPGRDDTVKACGYVKELVRSVQFALGLGRRAFLYNFCYPGDPTVRQICEAFHTVGDLPRPLGRLPAGVLTVAARGALLLERLHLSTDFHPDRVRKLMCSTRVAPRALVSAGYRFATNLRSGLADWRSESPNFV